MDSDVVLQLRDLVPPSSSANNPQQDGMDNKRPKHVVLSDTIALIKDLQDKVMCAFQWGKSGCSNNESVLTAKLHPYLCWLVAHLLLRIQRQLSVASEDMPTSDN